MSKKKYIKGLAVLGIVSIFAGGILVYSFNKNYLYNDTIAKNIFISEFSVVRKIAKLFFIILLQKSHYI